MVRIQNFLDHGLRMLTFRQNYRSRYPYVSTTFDLKEPRKFMFDKGVLLKPIFLMVPIASRLESFENAKTRLQ